jgi:hypothetical protein
MEYVMQPAVWISLGLMVAPTVVPIAITICDVLEYRKDNKVVAGNGQGNTQSSLRLQDIPKRIHIVQHGLGDRHKDWAVSAPTLRTVSEANGRTHNVFGMHLHCVEHVSRSVA